MAKLFFVGDSITAGAWDCQGGWANRLIGQIMQETMRAGFEEGRFYCLPYNLGVSGDTVADVLARLEREIKDRLDSESFDGEEEEAIEIVFAIGLNDSIYMVGEDRPRFSDDEFRENLRRLVVLSKQLAQRVSFVGLMPVNDDVLDPIPWAPEMAHRNVDVARFEAIISEVCAEHDLPFCPLFDRWTAMDDFDSYLIDGVHPNEKGHSLLEEQIGAFIFCDDFKSFHSD